MNAIATQPDTYRPVDGEVLHVLNSAKKLAETNTRFRSAKCIFESVFVRLLLVVFEFCDVRLLAGFGYRFQECVCAPGS